MLSPNTVARIKACKGVYSIGDTAKYFHCSKSSVHAIWTGKRHRDIVEAPEPANIISSRVDAQTILEDGRTLLQRGMKVTEAAAVLGVGKTTLYDHLRSEGVQPCYFF